MTSVMKLKTLAPWKESHDKPKQHIKRQRHHFANKGPDSHSYDFSSHHGWMWELDHKQGWVLKIWCLWIVLLETLLRVPWTARRSNQSILKEINPEYSLEGLMLKLAILWPSDVKSQLNGKDPDAGKNWRQKEKAAAEDKIIT